MSTEKFQQLLELSDSDLQSELEGTLSQYQRLKFDHTIKGLENPIGLRDVRRDVARLRTEIRRRELASASAGTLAKRSRIRSRRRKQK